MQSLGRRRRLAANRYDLLLLLLDELLIGDGLINGQQTLLDF